MKFAKTKKELKKQEPELDRMYDATHCRQCNKEMNTFEYRMNKGICFNCKNNMR